MMVPIDTKFNEEQLLLETFFSKVHIERGIRKKVMFELILWLKPLFKKVPGGGGEVGVLICCLGHHYRTLSALKLLPAHFAIFFLICLD